MGYCALKSNKLLLLLMNFFCKFLLIFLILCVCLLQRQGVGKGSPPVMPAEMKTAFSKKLRDLADKGFGLTKHLVQVKSAEFCEKARIATPFRNHIAGQTWYRNFMRRHPELSLREPSKLCTNRGKAMNRDIVLRYFEDARVLCSCVDSQFIWNMDESGFNFEHTPVKVLCQKGQKQLNARVSPSRQNVTIVACVSAGGTAMPPMFVVKGKSHKAVHGFNTMQAPPGSVWTFQEKAWMEDSLGIQWFRDVFLRHCGPERPQILFLDQHHSHEAVEMLKLAVKEGITITAFPPHTSH